MDTQKHLLQGEILVPVRLLKDLEMEIALQLALKSTFIIISSDFD